MITTALITKENTRKKKQENYCELSSYALLLASGIVMINVSGNYEPNQEN